MKSEFLKHIADISGKSISEINEIYKMPAFRGIRINPLKADFNTVQSGFDFELLKTPFYVNEYYIPSDCQKIGNHPFHHAGAFYSQEPSAASVIKAAKIKRGDRVLDLCAAPGGKSTGIAGELQNTGLLWSNEFVKSRSAILLSNIERLGVANAIVSNCDTGYLCSCLEGFFDTVIVDAPCSGEGMCRKNPEAEDEWNLENIIICAERQKEILSNAVNAVRPGGRLIYSTCTFNKNENEENVKWLLDTYCNIKIQNVESEYCHKGLDGYDFKNSVCRIFPDDGGEGHFIAEFLKESGNDNNYTDYITENVTAEMKKAFIQFTDENINKYPNGNLFEKSGKLYIVPKNTPAVKGSIIRYGLLAGEMKNGRFVPAHAFFACPYTVPKKVIDLYLNDERLKKFLHGEQIKSDECYKGYIGISVCGAPLGFGKQSGYDIKNHYPKGLRSLN